MASPSKWGSVLRLDGDVGDTSYRSEIAALADGRFIATWMVQTTSGQQQVRGQLLNADGSRKGAEFTLSGLLPGEMSVTGLTDGGFAIAWQDHTGVFPRLQAQTFDPDGNASSAPFFVSGTTADQEYTPQIAARPGGGFVTAWWAFDADEGDGDVMVRVFNADGSPAGNLPRFEADGGSSAFNLEVGVLGDGRIIATWSDSGAAYIRIFDTDGTPASAAIALHSVVAYAYKPVVTPLANGGFAAVWMDVGGESYDIYARVFDANGDSGAPIIVNATSAGQQYDPAVAQLPDGRLVVAWGDDGESGSNLSNIRVQVLNLDGTRSGDELLINQSAISFGNKPAVTVLADGRFVVSWHDYNPTESEYGLGEYAQIFDPREGPVTLNGTPLDDDWIGMPFDDTMRGAGGNDRIDGGAGEDTVEFAGSRDQYTVTDLGDRLVVSGPDGTDTLFNIEHVKFDLDIPEPPTPPVPAPEMPVDYISGLFDTRFYLSHNADVSAAGVSALDHYNAFGWREGRDPNAFFDSTGYLAANPAVRAAGLNPLDHYHETGWREGRDPSADFDTTLYLIHNPDVAAANVDPLEHYMQHGMAEGRVIHAAVGRDIGGFDAEYYAFHNPDVAAADVDPLAHFNIFGWHEGRNPNRWFDTAGYLAHYGDVAAAGANSLEHYDLFGWREGRDPSGGFDTLGYLAANPDVAAANVNPLEHFLMFGIYEGRQAVNDGLWH